MIASRTWTASQPLLPGFTASNSRSSLTSEVEALASSEEEAELAMLRAMLSACGTAMLPTKYVAPDAWAERNIIFSRPSDPVQGPIDFTLSPFLRDPIRAWDVPPGSGTREITVVAPEQIGKTLAWECGLGWVTEQRPAVSLIFYTSDVKAKMVNETKLLPLITNIPVFRSYLDLPNSCNASQYRLGPATINFGGVGARISSITSKYNVADELDDWVWRAGTNPLDDLRKRARAFSEGILCKVCTPKGTARQSRIWREFLNSSQGYWYLRCQHCGELTMRSCDIHNLQFELEEKKDEGVHPLPVADSIRLVCPVCKYEHTESYRRALVQQGAYVHRYPDRLNNLGFQIGYLANLFPAGEWYKIAVAQVNSGRSSDEEAQRFFDNSFRGLPFKYRRLDSTCSRALHTHQVTTPAPDVIRWRFLAADTQEECYYYVIRGVDARLNSYLLDCGRVDSTDALRRLIQTPCHGAPLFASIIDEGGHRQDEVRQLASLPRVYTYKGNTSIRAHWKVSEDFPRLLLGHAEFWRVQLLQKIYAAHRGDSYYWYTTEAMTDEYIKHLSAWSRPTSGKLADELSDGDVSCYRRTDRAPDHLFDAEKMVLMLIDYAWKRAIRPALESKLAARQAAASTATAASRAGAEPGTASVEGLPS